MIAKVAPRMCLNHYGPTDINTETLAYRLEGSGDKTYPKIIAKGAAFASIVLGELQILNAISIGYWNVSGLCGILWHQFEIQHAICVC